MVKIISMYAHYTLNICNLEAWTNANSFEIQNDNNILYVPTCFITKGHHGHPSSHHPAMAAAVAAAGLHPDTDTDPRELEAFAERFKQRRIKLGS